MTATARTAAAFTTLVGDAHVRRATAEDAVQGASPWLVIEPTDEAEIAAVLAEASRQHLQLVVRGGGTMLAWGAPPRRCDLILSMRRLAHLVEHQPGDLICVAGAGMTLAALQRALARAPGHRQQLMLDPPCPPELATLGGIVATGASGPLRSRYGTVRDLLIGVRFVLADGTIGHSGGKVVKNVAGYDLGKLLIGSLGTLAVITEVAFRLHPLAPATRTVLVERQPAGALAAAVAELANLPVTTSCVDLLWPAGVCAIRVDSSDSGADRQAQLITRRVGGRILDEAEAATLWASLANRPWAGEGAVAGLAVPRARLAGLLSAAAEHADELVIRAPLAAGEARLPADATRVAHLRSAVEGLGGHMVLHRASPALCDVVWPAADGIELHLMRSIKRALDPGGTLAPGRHLGGI